MTTENNERRSRRRGVMNPTVDATVDAEALADEAEESELDTDSGVVNAYTAPKGRPTTGRRNRVRVQEDEQGNVITRRSNSVMTRAASP